MNSGKFWFIVFLIVFVSRVFYILGKQKSFCIKKLRLLLNNSWKLISYCISRIGGNWLIKVRFKTLELVQITANFWKLLLIRIAVIKMHFLLVLSQAKVYISGDTKLVKPILNRIKFEIRESTPTYWLNSVKHYSNNKIIKLFINIYVNWNVCEKIIQIFIYNNFHSINYAVNTYLQKYAWITLFT